jgi:hypothetical protein
LFILISAGCGSNGSTSQDAGVDPDAAISQDGNGSDTEADSDVDASSSDALGDDVRSDVLGDDVRSDGMSPDGGSDDGNTALDSMVDATPSIPSVRLTTPADEETGVAINRSIYITFSEEMLETSINPTSFSLMTGVVPVPATVSVSGSQAILSPTVALLINTEYSATITTQAENLAGVPLEVDTTWTFTTGDGVAAGPAPVNLGTAGNFVILAKSGIDTIPISLLTGNIGVSPIDSTAITGFSLTMDSSGQYSTSSQVVGQVFAADYGVPTPSNLTTAISNLETAFVDAAGRAIPDFTELAGGDISGLTLEPGLYKWGTSVLISTDVTLNGGPDDVWIFQIGGAITQATGVQVILAGGARPQNIFWQAFGAVAIGADAHFEGIVLSQTEITLSTGATMNGRLLSQTAVTLDGNIVTEPDE